MNYDEAFYAQQRAGSKLSAEKVVPYLYELLGPNSVLDIGCGVGTWVSAFKKAGCETSNGMDGSWALESDLEIPKDDFIAFDFISSPAPFRPSLPLERYDLITTFEFAEHIFEHSAEALVDLITSKSDAVIFGAALPLQGGAHHVNEQWPSYWATKFAKRGFVSCDFIRPYFWDDLEVRPWYSQNAIGYFRGEVPKPVREAARAAWENRGPLSLVHPSSWLHVNSLAEPTSKNITRQANLLARRTAKKLLRRS